MEKRVFENPIIKDKVSIIKSTKETSGEYLLLQIELAAGGGNGLHYHTTFREEFTAISGNLSIEKKFGKIVLKPGETATAHINELHRFFNETSETITFQVRISPGHEGFENGLRIAYGLASDGKTNKKGVPSKFDHLAIILDLTDTRLTGWMSLIEPFILRKAKKARSKGVEDLLLRDYC